MARKNKPVNSKLDDQKKKKKKAVIEHEETEDDYKERTQDDEAASASDDEDDSDFNNLDGSNPTGSLDMQHILNSLKSKLEKRMLRKQNNLIKAINDQYKTDLNSLNQLIDSHLNQTEVKITEYFTLSNRLKQKKQDLTSQIIQSQNALNEILTKLSISIKLELDSMVNSESDSIQQINQIKQHEISLIRNGFEAE